MPADRFDTAADLASALANQSFGWRRVGSSGLAMDGSSPRVRWIAVTLAVITVVMTVVAVLGWMRSPDASLAVTRFPLEMSDVPRQLNEWGPSLAISRDGRQLAYLGPDTTNTWESGNWWIRRFDDLDPSWAYPYAEYAVFSPDGQAMAFRTGAYLGEIRITSLQGDRHEMLTDSAGSPGIDWAPDGWIYYQYRHGPTSGIARVPAEGGPVEILTSADREAGEYHGWPHALPNGRGVIFTAARRGRFAFDDRDIMVLDLNTGAQSVLVRGNLARYAITGHLLFARPDGGLFAAPFDLVSLEITGSAVRVVDGISFNGGVRGADFDVSETGTLTYVTDALADLDEVVVVDRTGAAEEVFSGWGGRLRYPAMSPDGSKIAATVFRERSAPNIFVMALNTGELQRLTFGGALDYHPRWTDGGRRIAFVGPRPPARTDWDLYIKPVDLTGPESLLVDVPGEITEPDLTVTASWAVFAEERASRYDVRAVNLRRDGEAIDIAATDFNERSPKLSPDGRFVSYVSDQSGRDEVYVKPFPNARGGPWQVSLEGGEAPVWARDGRELYFVSGDKHLVATRIRTSPSFIADQRRPLFSMADYQGADYDVTADGRFIVIRRRELEAPGDVVLVQNWFEELRAMVGN